MSHWPAQRWPGPPSAPSQSNDWMEHRQAVAPRSSPSAQSPLSWKPTQFPRCQATPTWLYQRPPAARLRASSHREIWLSFESTAPLFAPWFRSFSFPMAVVFAPRKCPQQRLETPEFLQPAHELNRVFGVFARQYKVGAVAKLVAELGPAHRLLRMSAGNVGAAFDHFAVFEFDSDSRAHLIVTESLQLVVDIKRYPLHQLHNFPLTDLSIYKLCNASFTLQNANGHAKRNAEFSFQRCFGHWVDQCIWNVGIRPDIDGLDVVGVQIMFFYEIED